MLLCGTLFSISSLQLLYLDIARISTDTLPANIPCVLLLLFQHAPMLVTCAREGVLVVAIQYTLYPEVKTLSLLFAGSCHCVLPLHTVTVYSTVTVCHNMGSTVASECGATACVRVAGQILSCAQTEEVGCALTWTMDNIARYGGTQSASSWLGTPQVSIQVTFSYRSMKKKKKKRRFCVVIYRLLWTKSGLAGGYTIVQYDASALLLLVLCLYPGAHISALAHLGASCGSSLPESSSSNSSIRQRWRGLGLRRALHRMAATLSRWQGTRTCGSRTASWDSAACMTSQVI